MRPQDILVLLFGLFILYLLYRSGISGSLLEPYSQEYIDVQITDDAITFVWWSKGWSGGNDQIYRNGYLLTRVGPFSTHNGAIVDTDPPTLLSQYAFGEWSDDCHYEGKIRLKQYICNGQEVTVGWHDVNVRGKCLVKVSPQKTVKADNGKWEYQFYGEAKLLFDDENFEMVDAKYPDLSLIHI